MENIETLLAAVAQTQGFNDVDDETGGVESRGKASRSCNSEAVGGKSGGVQLNGDALPSVMVDVPPPHLPAAITVVEVAGGGQRRKRGRPPKGQLGRKTPPLPPLKRMKLEDEEEDVCFICFDGGSLVLCDRKGCPKAYHPACIKRDEAFFKSKAKWTCGWHICSVCQKASYHMCYTCTYSLCKGCIRDANFSSVRGNKGFCPTCMKTIMLIENKDQANNESVLVDFDDKGSWEYLFKVYWLILKEKLSLTLNELLQAKNIWKGVNIAIKPDLHSVQHTAVNGNLLVSYRSTEQLELNKPHVETTLQRNDRLMSKPSSNDNKTEQLNGVEGEDGPRHNDDSIKPNKDIKNNKDEPSSGKAKAESSMGEATDKASTEKDLDKQNIVEGADRNVFPMATSGRKRKGRKKSKVKIVMNNLNEYAAIDVHNIILIYLRCNMMENLLREQESFSDKVIGSMVRIKIPSDDHNQGDYRLVQVVGTIKSSEPYKIGDRTADFMIEILNSGKKEVVSVDAISNQEFTEDECRGLRRSVKSGLMKPFTVGEVHKKAMELQPVRINDLMEVEIMRLCNLRDRANANGNKKLHREFVTKLQLLKSPEERMRRITEVPKIHSDPKMSPDYASDGVTKTGDNSKKDEYVRPSCSGICRNGRKPASPNKKAAEVKGGRTTRSKSRKMANANGLQNSDKNMNPVSDNTSVGIKSDQAVQRSGLEASTATACAGNSPCANHIETENLWHYRDPHGKIQGPFSMIQLRKWSTTGFFAPDMRIWTNHEQYDSVLLTDALNGHFHATLELSREPATASQENETSGGIQVHEVRDLIMTKGSEQAGASQCSNASILSENNAGLVGEDKLGSSSWPQCWDMLKDNNTSADDVQGTSVPSSSSCQQTGDAHPAEVQESKVLNRGENITSEMTENQVTCGHDRQNQFKNEDKTGHSSEENLRSLNIDWSLNDTESVAVFAPVSKSPDSSGHARNIDVLDLLSTAPNSAPVSQLPDSSKQVGNIDVLDLLSPTLKIAENQQSVSSDARSASILELLSLTPRSNKEDQAGQGTHTTQPELLNSPVPSLGPSWSGASGLMVGGVMQLSNAAGEWCGASPIPAKPAALGWDSGLCFLSSLKPPEGTTSENPTALTSDGHQITHASALDTTNWLSIVNEPIEFDALGEDYVSDLLAQVDAMESQGTFPPPTSPMRFARELSEDCKDDCFSSIEDFSLAIDPPKSDAQSSTGEIQLVSRSPSAPCKPTQTFDVFDSLTRSSVHSSTSSEGETNAPVYDAGSECHPLVPNNMNQDFVNAAMITTTGAGSDTVDPAWGTVQGNINLVTVQGNVNLVLGGLTQGMTNLGWGTNPGTTWANPNMNHSASLPWDNQRKYCSERFTSPRERGYHGGDSGSSRARAQWGRQPYGGSSGGGSSSGGYSRTIPKGQRVCKFYESGHCKKGAFCDYLHP